MLLEIPWKRRPKPLLGIERKILTVLRIILCSPQQAKRLAKSLSQKEHLLLPLTISFTEKILGKRSLILLASALHALLAQICSLRTWYVCAVRQAADRGLWLEHTVCSRIDPATAFINAHGKNVPHRLGDTAIRARKCLLSF